MPTILYVSFFTWTVLGVLSTGCFAFLALSIRRRRRANLPRCSFDDKLAAAALGTMLLALPATAITAVGLWPSSALSWGFLILVNLLLQPLFLRVMKNGLCELSLAIRGPGHHPEKWITKSPTPLSRNRPGCCGLVPSGSCSCWPCLRVGVSPACRRSSDHHGHSQARPAASNTGPSTHTRL